ncbi:MAG TPA: hypothetical protein VL096_10815, partial [Pirellulaceae bacterium]|nr:hypothetical protein [Pirellulaceae bacterium]
VEPLRPIETTVPYDPTNKGLDKLKDNFKAEYINYVKSTALPRLAEAVGATWSPSDSAQGASALGGNRGGGERGGIEGTTTDDGPQEIVHWNPGNQSDLQEKRFDWRKEVGGRPSTLQILYAQEDLWVLETLIKIIAKTNADADAPHNAVVKDIEYLKIGADAVGLSGGVMRLTTAGATGTEGGPLATGAPPVVMPAEGGAGGPLGAAGVGPVDPALGRYVDSNYKPVEPDRLRLAFTSTNAEDAFLAVAKRMPVRMHLTVDQRKLHRLLAECGNSNLVVEIRQMRINRPVYAGGPGGGGGAIAGGGFGGERGGGGGGFGGNQSRGGGGESQLGTADLKPVHDIQVELYGIVYIYNPVNEAMVAAVASGDGSPVEAPAAPVAPVPTPMGVTPAPVAPAVPAVPGPGGVVPAAPMPAVPAPGVPAPMPVVPAPMPAVPVPVVPAPIVPAPGGAVAPMPAVPAVP